MFSISLLVNGQPIYTRSARNTGRVDDKGNVAYEVDTGDIVFHNPDKGALVLARKLLDTIVESKKRGE